MANVEVPVQILENMLADDETKDVEIATSNGILFAHAVVLRAHSDGLRGILANGVMTDGKRRLNWIEHSIEVSRFFIRLLYAGTVAPEEWGTPKCAHDRSHDGCWYRQGGSFAAMIKGPSIYWADTGVERDQAVTQNANTCVLLYESVTFNGSLDSRGNLSWDDGEVWFRRDDVPLQLLIGGLALAKMYVVLHLINSFTEALKRRLTAATFDDICRGAINSDVTALRLACLRYAETASQIQTTVRVKAKEDIKVGDAIIAKGMKGQVVGCRTFQSVLWSHGVNSTVDEVMTRVELQGTLGDGDHPLCQLYKSESLAPEVMSELAGMWAPAALKPKRSRLV